MESDNLIPTVAMMNNDITFMTKLTG